jgi:hypothetical protein
MLTLLEYERRRRRLTLAELGELAGLNKGGLNKMEMGIVPAQSGATMAMERALAAFFGITLKCSEWSRPCPWEPESAVNDDAPR